MALSRNILTILAALRYYQGDLYTTALPEEIVNIATDNGDAEALSVGEIDVLCEDLNTEKWALLRSLGDMKFQHGEEGD